MGGYFVLWGFYLLIVIALVRPTWGILGFYGWILLQPNWNWRWVIPAEANVQAPLIIATGIGFAISLFRGNRLSGIPLASNLSFGLFLLLAYISALTTLDPNTSYIYLDILWKIGLSTFLLTLLLDTPKKIQAFLWIAILAQSYNAYQINRFYFEDGYCRFVSMTNWGYQGDNNIYSNLTVSIVFISLTLAIFAKTLWLRALAGFIALIQAHQIMLMESRGAMLAGVAALVFWFFFIPKNPKSILVAGLLFCLGAVLAGPSVVTEFMSSFASESDIDGSAASRFDVWRAGLQITLEYPAFGVGPNCARYLVPIYVELPETTGEKSLHNLFLEISAGCGIPAFICYFVFFFLPLISILRDLVFRFRNLPHWLQTTYLATLTGLLAFMLGSLFSAAAQLESSYMLVAVANAARLVYLRQLREGVAEPVPHLVEEQRIGTRDRGFGRKPAVAPQ
jgi:O-antigen ligase